MSSKLVPSVHEYVTNLTSIQQNAQFHLAKAKESQKIAADKHRSAQPLYAIGDKVW